MDSTELTELESPCVCKRNFSWKRILHPNREKSDPDNWVVCFGPGIGDSRWESWCKLVVEGLFNPETWGVLMVTSESPELQYLSPLYQQYDCSKVRTLSDTSGRVGELFGLALSQGAYEFSLVFVHKGEILGRCSMD